MTPIFGPTNPSPDEQQASGVQRFAYVIELKPEREKLYRELHADVWPDVRDATTRANMKNASIFLFELGGKKYLIRYFEYTGDNAEQDFAAVADDATTRDKWWPITDDCQLRLPGTPDGEQWLPTEMVMHLP